MVGEGSTTVNLDEQARVIAPELQLVVVGPADFTTIPLLPGRDYMVGRGPSANLRLNDEGVSREHATLVVGKTGVEIQDLASGNGTLMAGKKLAPRTLTLLRFGEPVTVGSTILMLQTLRAAMQRRRVWSHVYFLGRLEEECFKAPELGSPFTVLRLRLPEDMADAQAGTLVSPALRPLDIIARYGSRDWEMLLPGQDRRAAEATFGRIRDQLGKQGSQARAGIAEYAVDGRDPAALLAAASLAIHGGAGPSEDAPTTIVAVSPPMKNMLALVERIAGAQSESASILILGETGVGKSVLARWIHDHSPRAKGPYLRIDVPALKAELIESELFGHKRGAFTTAITDRVGLLEAANGGSLHLDEIGELPPELQLKLLTALQERKVTRVGDTQPRAIDVRVMASTSRDLRADVVSGRFRKDLFFRLAVFPVVVPPLRERPAEIEPLARALLARAAARAKMAEVPDLSPEALAVLQEHDWPGNVREVENAMERAVVLCSGSVIEAEHLQDLNLLGENHDPAEAVDGVDANPDLSDLGETHLKERKKVLAVLAEHQWVVERAAQAYGLGKTAFYRRMRRLKIPPKSGR